MAESAESLNGNYFSGCDLEFANAVEYGDSGAENGCVFIGVDVFGDADYGFGAEVDEFGEASVAGYAVDGAVGTHLTARLRS